MQEGAGTEEVSKLLPLQSAEWMGGGGKLLLSFDQSVVCGKMKGCDGKMVGALI
jgi:hypothetical protein